MTPEQLILAFQQARTTLRARLLTAVGQAWERTAGPSEEDERAWLALIVPLVLGAQAAMTALTNAFTTNMLTAMTGARLRPLPISPADFSGGGVRGGVQPAEVYSRSIRDLRIALSEGKPYMDGFAQGQARAEQSADMDLQLTHREVSRAVMGPPEGGFEVSRTEDGPGARLYVDHPDYEGRGGEFNKRLGSKVRIGTRRALTGESCELCVRHSETVYPLGRLAPTHPHCDCILVPVLRGDDPAAANNKPRLDKLMGMLADANNKVPEVAVHQHGELGPLLREQGHHFKNLPQ